MVVTVTDIDGTMWSVECSSIEVPSASVSIQVTNAVTVISDPED
jgi:hypothetical protein